MKYVSRVWYLAAGKFRRCCDCWHARPHEYWVRKKNSRLVPVKYHKYCLNSPIFWNDPRLSGIWRLSDIIKLRTIYTSLSPPTASATFSSLILCSSLSNIGIQKWIMDGLKQLYLKRIQKFITWVVKSELKSCQMVVMVVIAVVIHRI